MSLASRAQAGIRAHPAVVPGALIMAILIAIVPLQAGYQVTTWYPVAIAVLALLVLSLLVLPARRDRIPRIVLVAVGAFAAFTGWCYLSILWASDQGAAFDAANRTLLYLMVFAAFALWAQSGSTASVLLGAWTLGIATNAAVVLVRVSGATDPARFFTGDRLVSPVGYVNATAALWLMALWPAVVLASRRGVAWWLRGLFAAAAVLLADTAILSESRGAIFSTPIVLIVLFLLVPARVRTFAVLVPIAGAIALTASPLLDLGTHVVERPGPDAVAGLATPPLLAALAVAIIVSVAGLIESRWSRSEAVDRRIHRAGVVLAVASAVVIVAGGIVVAKNPVHRAENAWHSFKGGYASASTGSRITAQGLGSNRYDFYRVGLDEFASHPIAGIGGDNFLQPYLAKGHSDETPRFPHSWEIRTILGYGIVGALLLLAAFGAALVAVVRTTMRADAFTGGIAAGAAMVMVYWLVHGSFDWFWEFAGLGASAFAMLGLACSLVPRTALAAPSRRPLIAGWAPIAGVAVTAVVLAALLAGPWWSARLTESAAVGWQIDQGQAFRRLNTAADLNPLSDNPAIVGGTIAVRLDELPTARIVFQGALRRNPRGAYATLMLGAIASETGDRPLALRLLARAVALNPRDPISRAALARVRAGGVISASGIDRAVAARARAFSN